MHRGYLALWRRYQDHPFWKERRVFSKAEAWIDILWEAQHSQKPQQVILGMNVLVCNYGECLKSIQTWGLRWGWGKSKVLRFFDLLEKLNQIRYKSETITTRLTVLNYEQYDPRRNGNGTQAERSRNDPGTQAGTDNNVKNVKNEKVEPFSPEKNKIPYQKIITYLNQKANKDFRHNTKGTQRIIKARWNEGFRYEDFQRVIDSKSSKWLADSKMVDYLRPQTLFGPKFESYLNESPATQPEELDAWSNIPRHQAK